MVPQAAVLAAFLRESVPYHRDTLATKRQDKPDPEGKNCVPMLLMSRLIHCATLATTSKVASSVLQLCQTPGLAIFAVLVRWSDGEIREVDAHHRACWKGWRIRGIRVQEISYGDPKPA